MIQHNVFIPNGESRHETAVLLVGTAEEYGIDQHAIKATTTGFFITDELADLVYDGATEDEDAVEETETETKDTQNASGNRAAKTGTNKE